MIISIIHAYPVGKIAKKKKQSEGLKKKKKLLKDLLL